MFKGKRTISKAQLRTLQLLNEEFACRTYWSKRQGDYTWVHKGSGFPITVTLNQLFVRGCADLSADNRDVAVITDWGRAVLMGHDAA
jgi:hypothetical protein